MLRLTTYRSLRFSSKYFWFGNEAIDEKSLAAYLKAEKAETGYSNAAFASQTGKGLLLFAKREEDKSSPSGILNLVSNDMPNPLRSKDEQSSRANM